MTTTRCADDGEEVDAAEMSEASETPEVSEELGKVVMGSITGVPLWVCGPVVL